MSTKRYFDILGISPTKDEKVVKKAYRKQVMKYHPDRNPSEVAKDKFIEITEAYERFLLILSHANKRPTNTYRPSQDYAQSTNYKSTYQKTSTSTREERVEEARRRYEERKRKENLENERYFQKITTGKKWKLFKTIMYACTFFALFFTVDQFILPSKTIAAHIVEKNPSIRLSSAGYETTSPVVFNNGQKAFISTKFIALEEMNYMYLERTFFFKDIKNVKVWRDNKWYTYTPDFGMISNFPLTLVILLIPLFGFILKSKTLYFSLLFNVSFYLMPIVLIGILILNDRWAQLVTLGLLE